MSETVSCNQGENLRFCQIMNNLERASHLLHPFVSILSSKTVKEPKDEKSKLHFQYSSVNLGFVCPKVRIQMLITTGYN